MCNEYPRTIYAYVILLDNKIENWKVCYSNYNSISEISGFWKINRLNDYKLQKVCWVCKDSLECLKAFDELAPNWFKTWRHDDDYKLVRAY